MNDTTIHRVRELEIGCKPAADVRVQNEGTIVMFHLLTAKAESWVDEHVADDPAWWGGALLVEHRYAGAVIAGLLDDGLKLQNHWASWSRGGA